MSRGSGWVAKGRGRHAHLGRSGRDDGTVQSRARRQPPRVCSLRMRICSTRPDARLEDMIWGVPEILAELSTSRHLQPGDRVEGGVDGLGQLVTKIGPPTKPI